MLLLYAITPTLGFIRNYIKYKQLNILLYLRSPIIYFTLIIYHLFTNQRLNIYKILIYERWIMFLYKSFISLYNNDYKKNKIKYMEKYNIKYK